jgi:hypothetical protein
MANPIVELAVHVKLASESVVVAAEQMAALEVAAAGAGALAACTRVMDELIALNVQLALMERILHFVTRQSATAASAV